MRTAYFAQGYAENGGTMSFSTHGGFEATLVLFGEVLIGVGGGVLEYLISILIETR